MRSLLDIGPLTEAISINGAFVDVRGVTPEGFFYLLARFPVLSKLFGGGARDISAATLQTAAPECIAHAIAVATTDRSEFPSVEKWRETVERAAVIATRISAHHQMQIFEAALRLTFPEGIGPFMRSMKGLADSLNRLNEGGSAPATPSSRPSRSGFTTDSRGMRLGRGAPSESSVH